MIKQLDILFQDDQFVAVFKPHDVMVHKSELCRDRHTLMSLLRNQLGQWVWPVHRLDRATCGVIVFGLSSEAAGALAKGFRERDVEKTYLAVVRGFAKEQDLVDRPMRDGNEGERQVAITRYRRMETVELDVQVDKYPTSRYSLIEVKPETGRRHQIRKHCKHIANPIIGDSVYGNGAHNRFFRDRFKLKRLLLMSRGLSFQHPYTNETIHIRADLDTDWSLLFHTLGWSLEGAANAIAD